MISATQNFEKKKDKTFADESGEFGLKWANRYKRDPDQFPTFEEMMTGIFKWYTN